MSERPCLHCTLLAAVVDHFPEDPGVEAVEAAGALATVIGQILAAVPDRGERFSLLNSVGRIIATNMVGTDGPASTVRH